MTIILYKLRDRKSKEIDDELEISETIGIHSDRLDSTKGRNIVPLEEVLIINNKKTKREQLINILKGETFEYLDMLKLALRDDDVETSHYAASAISEIKRNLDLKLQAIAVEYEKSKDNIKVISDYADVLEEYLNSNLLEASSRKELLYTYIELLEKLVTKQKKQFYYHKLINNLLEVDSFEKAGSYCKSFLETIECEAAYLDNLKYYYCIRDKTGFNRILARLQSSSIKLSNRGINIIRFWLEGV